MIQDLLVKEGILPGGDHSEVLTTQVEIEVRKYHRAMEIRLSRATPAEDP